MSRICYDFVLDEQSFFGFVGQRIKYVWRESRKKKDERKKTKEKRRKKNGSQREFFCFPLAKTDKTWYNKTYYPPVAQLDNATDSDSGDRGFKSLRADQNKRHPFWVPFVLVRIVSEGI